MVILHGIPNCDTVKKARRWIEANGVAYCFHDLRKEGLDPELLERWVRQLGWETLLNRKGLLWRRLPENLREGIDEASACRLMLADPAIIKRPVLERGDVLQVGFSEQRYRELLG